MKRFFAFITLLLSICISAQATHLKAANITYKHLQGLSFQVKVTLFSDSGSPVVPGSNGLLSFGDGTTATLDASTAQAQKVGPETWRYEYTLEHTFRQADSYLISFSEGYRNEGIQNIENSVNTNFYLESLLNGYITTANSSPKIQNPPLGEAFLGETFYYNPMASDPEGDSLSYHLVPAKQGKNQPVAAYTFPHRTFAKENASETGEEAYLFINPATGDLVWDAPVQTGEYNLVIQIREWRFIGGEYVQIGAVEQDMQIEVQEQAASRLRLSLSLGSQPLESQQLQLETGETLEFSIRAIPENAGDTVILELSGDFLQAQPTLSPADSVGGKGTQVLHIQYTPAEAANKRYQLIATAYLYTNEQAGTNRSRAVFLLAPGFINGIRELEARRILLYPNPSSTNRFYLQAPELEGRTLSISLFNAKGRLVHQELQRNFKPSEGISVPGKSLHGTYLLLLQQQDKLYFSRIVFVSN